MMPICKGNHASHILTCHKARMLHRKAAVQCHPPAVSLMYGLITWTTEVGGQGGKGNDMCWWVGTQSVPHPRRICCRLPRAVSCQLLSGKLVSGYLVPHNKCGSPVWSDPQDQKKTMEILRQQADGLKPKAFISQGLRPVNPFWANLPYYDIFQSFTPNIHHQLHKGIFKDHFVTWCTEAVDGGSKEVDCHFKSMISYPTLCHFKKGISLVS